MNPANTKSAIAIPAPTITFADVLNDVERAPNLSKGVRGNMRSAVRLCANLVSNQGLSGVADVQAMSKRFEKLTPAALGFQNPNSLAAFKSNLRRSLQLAHVKVMPGRHRAPLEPEWAALAQSLREQDRFLWVASSRFVHFLSEGGIGPEQVDKSFFTRFVVELRSTCLGSEAEKTTRETVRAWKRAGEFIPGWPKADLGHARKKSDTPLLPWSAFPPTLEIDAREFVERGEDDWLSSDLRRPLKPRTRQNYLDGLRRIASILVALGTPVEQLHRLADMVELDRVKAVLRAVSDRTGRVRGGHTMQLALLLYMAGRDQAKVPKEHLSELIRIFRRTRPEQITMSNRTLARLSQFDDGVELDKLIRLPDRLMEKAEKQAVPEIRSAKLARIALYLKLLQETCARSGNVVGLDLDQHLIPDNPGVASGMFVVIPAHEVKNGQEIRVRLSGTTTRMLRRYVERYRPIHCADQSSWLFARQNGSHWTVDQACIDLKDIVARYVGPDVTPHLMRSLAGKILLDAHPGAIATVQQLLGHKSFDTTLRFYARLEPAKARTELQEILEQRRKGAQ